MPKRTLFQAKLEVAKAWQAQELARQAWAAASPMDEPDKGDCPEKKEWKYAEHKSKALLRELASDPDLRKHMTCTELEFRGSQEPKWLKGNDPTPTQMEIASWGGTSNLANEVREWIYSHQQGISASGSGVGGWDMSIDGSYEEISKLADLAFEHFAKYIDAGVLKLSLRLRDWRFRGFGYNEIQEMLKGN